MMSSYLRSNPSYLNLLNHACFWSSAIIVLWASGLNENGFKFTQINKKHIAAHNKELPSHVASCDRVIVALNQPDSWLCCDSSLHGFTWLCESAYDSYTRIMSSYNAFYLPLLPAAVTMLIDVIMIFAGYTLVEDSSKGERSKVMGQIGQLRSIFYSHFLRIALYFALILFRTVSFTQFCGNTWP